MNKEASSSDTIPIKTPTRKSKYVSKRLPDEVLERMSLKDLVDQRPRHNSRGSGIDYKDNFARHPQVRSINLQDPNPLVTAKKLFDLQGDGNLPPQYKSRLTASVKQLVIGTPFKDEKLKQDLLETLNGMRNGIGHRERNRTYRQRLGPEGMRQQRLALDKKHFEETGKNYIDHLKMRQEANTRTNKPLCVHLVGDGEDSKKLTALEVEHQASELSRFYTSDAVLTRELERCLLERGVPPDQFAMAIAKRSHRMRIRYNARRAERKRTNKGIAQPTSATTTASMAASTSGRPIHSGIAAGSRIHSVSPVSDPGPQTSQQDNLSLPRQQSPFRFDPEDQAEWRWLTSILNP